MAEPYSREEWEKVMQDNVHLLPASQEDIDAFSEVIRQAPGSSYLATVDTLPQPNQQSAEEWSREWDMVERAKELVRKEIQDKLGISEKSVIKKECVELGFDEPIHIVNILLNAGVIRRTVVEGKPFITFEYITDTKSFLQRTPEVPEAQPPIEEKKRSRLMLKEKEVNGGDNNNCVNNGNG